MCLDRARLLPTNLRRSQLHLVDALYDVMSLIFDRNASLLPGYFIVNELLKLYPDYKHWPHWVCCFPLLIFITFSHLGLHWCNICEHPQLSQLGCMWQIWTLKIHHSSYRLTHCPKENPTFLERFSLTTKHCSKELCIMRGLFYPPRWQCWLCWYVVYILLLSYLYQSYIFLGILPMSCPSLFSYWTYSVLWPCSLFCHWSLRGVELFN